MTSLKKKQYMQPVINMFDNKLDELMQSKEVLDFLTDILEQSKEKVEKILEDRKNKGEIKWLMIYMETN